MGEPLLLRPEEVARLTDRQIVDLYYHPRDSKGRITPRKERVEVSETTPEESRRQMRQMMRAFGVDPGGKENELTRERDPA